MVKMITLMMRVILSMIIFTWQFWPFHWGVFDSHQDSLRCNQRSILCLDGNYFALCSLSYPVVPENIHLLSPYHSRSGSQQHDQYNFSKQLIILSWWWLKLSCLPPASVGFQHSPQLFTCTPVYSVHQCTPLYTLVNQMMWHCECRPDLLTCRCLRN